MNKRILSVESLTTSFKVGHSWLPVVNDISFEVAAGETLAIVGESGSGKSVAALSIMGLHDLRRTRQQGTINFLGRDLLTTSEKELQRIRGAEIAMIFQDPMMALNPVLTIGRQLGETLMFHRGLSVAAAKREAISLLDKVRIPAASSRLSDYPHNFSGGMRQRVMIAIALACDPKLLIADEPTTALDVTIQAQILDLIKSIQAENNMGMIFITHDMGVVAEVADRTLVMRRGVTLECQKTQELFVSPGTSYTRALLAAVPRLGSMTGRSAPAFFPEIDAETGIAQDEEAATPLDAAAELALDVRNLTTRFPIKGGFFGKPIGQIHAVENVSFTLKAGETLSLVGESGSGKSTTGRSILRLTEPLGGSVVSRGKDLLTLKPTEQRSVRRNIQMIFQDPFSSLNPRMSIGASIAEPLIINNLASHAEARDRIATLLSEVGLHPEMMSRYPHEFSGGQRQRICIARALSVDPKVIVADECVSALDVTVKAQIINLMMRLQDKLKVAFLFISHDMAVVERVSHRVAVMFMGEIVEIGPREAIFANPQHPYTKRLLAAVPLPDPSQRNRTHNITDIDLRSPIRQLDYVPPSRSYREVAPGHRVMEWGEEWARAAC